MQQVLTSTEMSLCDSIAIDKYKIPSLLLMENAGRSVVDLINNSFAPIEEKSFLIFCGKGNNGGDGFVVARLLSNKCKNITVVLVEPSKIKGDAKINLNILLALSKKINNIKVVRFTKSILTNLQKSDFIIDALFGTGFKGSVKNSYYDIITYINSQNSKIISVDIPSGIDGTYGIAENIAVKSNLTITFQNLKTGLLCNKGIENSGSVCVADIGIPNNILHSFKNKTFIVEKNDIVKSLPKRSLHAHKYSVGKVFVIAGSVGLTGAATLCCNAAYRSGVGAVVLGTPMQVYNILAKKLTETMVHPLPSTSNGTLSFSGYDEIEKKMEWSDVLLIGPGLSKNDDIKKIVLKILNTYKRKIIIDADGLNVLSKSDIVKATKLNSQIIITPHVGEFSRLTGLTSKEIEHKRIEHAREFAKSTGVVVVLKGVPTVTANPDGCVMINASGNSGMATAGCGDVLSGIIAGFAAQGMDIFSAAWSGAYIHGLAGDSASNIFGKRSIVANDLIDNLPSTIKKMELE